MPLHSKGQIPTATPLLTPFPYETPFPDPASNKTATGTPAFTPARYLSVQVSLPPPWLLKAIPHMQPERPCENPNRSTFHSSLHTSVPQIIPRGQAHTCLRTFALAVLSAWNALPSDTPQAPSLTAFRSLLKNSLPRNLSLATLFKETMPHNPYPTSAPHLPSLLICLHSIYRHLTYYISDLFIFYLSPLLGCQLHEDRDLCPVEFSVPSA